MSSSIEKLRERREDILKAAQKYGAYNIRVFGSVVRNEENYNSDIDFLVEFESKRSLFDLIRLKLELEEMLGKEVDIVTERSLNSSIAQYVRKEVVEL